MLLFIYLLRKVMNFLLKIQIINIYINLSEKIVRKQDYDKKCLR
jgi:hypothetical protein